jgi:hypothetical protein
LRELEASPLFAPDFPGDRASPMPNGPQTPRRRCSNRWLSGSPPSDLDLRALGKSVDLAREASHFAIISAASMERRLSTS